MFGLTKRLDRKNGEMEKMLGKQKYISLWLCSGRYYKHITIVNDDSSDTRHLLTTLESSFKIVMGL
jgi:hypothetical protein